VPENLREGAGGAAAAGAAGARGTGGNDGKNTTPHSSAASDANAGDCEVCPGVEAPAFGAVFGAAPAFGMGGGASTSAVITSVEAAPGSDLPVLSRASICIVRGKAYLRPHQNEGKELTA
jgi:hypothetical protein